MGMFADKMKNESTSGGGIFAQHMNFPTQETPVQAAPAEEDSIFDTVANKVGTFLSNTAAPAFEALAYLDKPRGALAGGVHAALDNSDIVEGMKSGWDKNTSWKDVIFSKEEQEEQPIRTTVTGLGYDIFADPLWLVSPAKALSMAGKVAKMTGITDHLVRPAASAFKNTQFGKAAIANTEDFLGKNRVREAGIDDDFFYGMAQDAVKNADYTDNLKNLRQQWKASGATDDVINQRMGQITDYIEAANRPGAQRQLTQQMKTDIVDSIKRGDGAKDIASGKFTKEEALTALREAGADIPDYLLQQHQIDAILSGKKGMDIPDYVYRDEILNQIQDPNLRTAIQIAGDRIIQKNKDYADLMKQTGLLGDEAAVHFADGSHLRRSYEKYETPEEFLDAVRKNGTSAEWQRAYADYQKTHGASSMGTTALHKIDKKDFMKRQQLSTDTLGKMGIIQDAEYRVADTFNRASKALNEQQWLESVAGTFGKTEAEAARLSRDLPSARQYVPVPDDKAYGALAGKWVPKDVMEKVLRQIGAKQDVFGQKFQKYLSRWKAGKLANPASIMRNFYSGLPMANVFGKVPMYELPKYMGRIGIAAGKGKNKSALWREFLGSGALEGQLSKSELSNILGKNHAVLGSDNLLTAAGKKYDSFMENYGMKAFNAPDVFWRAVVYSYYRDKGKSVKEAGAIARKALLDYSNTPEWVRKVAGSGLVPFARFPYHATKATAKAMWHDPASATKYYKPQNQFHDEDQDNILPDYLKAENLLPMGEKTRMVNGKEQKVKRNLDLSNIYPFANDVSVGNPLLDALELKRTGKNGLGQEVIREGMTNKDMAKAYAEYAANSVLPAMASTYSWGKLKDAYKGNVDSKGRQYDMEDAIMQVGLGLKNVPINTDEMAKNQMTHFKNEERNAKAMMNRIKKDKSLTQEQRLEKIEEYKRQILGIRRKEAELKQSYKRLKQKEK